MKNLETFNGVVKWVSSSPHGDPEGVVLSDGIFIKIPPHSLLHPEKIVKGAEVSGEGERISSKLNDVFHHVKLKVGSTVVADDQGKPHEKDALKEKHKRDIEAKKKTEAPAEKTRFTGKIEAFATKPKGEIDRIIFADGTSAHLPKEVELDGAKLKRGDTLTVEGELRTFKELRFLKAKAVFDAKGDSLS